MTGLIVGDEFHGRRVFHAVLALKLSCHNQQLNIFLQLSPNTRFEFNVFFKRIDTGAEIEEFFRVLDPDRLDDDRLSPLDLTQSRQYFSAPLAKRSLSFAVYRISERLHRFKQIRDGRRVTSIFSSFLRAAEIQVVTNTFDTALSRIFQFEPQTGFAATPPATSDLLGVFSKTGGPYRRQCRPRMFRSVENLDADHSTSRGTLALFPRKNDVAGIHAMHKCVFGSLSHF